MPAISLAADGNIKRWVRSLVIYTHKHIEKVYTCCFFLTYMAWDPAGFYYPLISEERPIGNPTSPSLLASLRSIWYGTFRPKTVLENVCSWFVWEWDSLSSKEFLERKLLFLILMGYKWLLMKKSHGQGTGILVFRAALYVSSHLPIPATDPAVVHRATQKWKLFIPKRFCIVQF